MSSTIDLLNSATLNINIYFAIFICITGFFGGLLNIIVFTTLRTFRQTTCATYLMAASVYDLGQSLTVLLRIFNTAFNYNSSILCKFRFFFSQYFCLSFHTCMCMSTIDQYISMTKYHQLNNKRLAHYHIIFFLYLLVYTWYFYFYFL